MKDMCSDKQNIHRQFCAEIKKLAATCEFGDNRDDFICDQVIDKCLSETLRRWLLRGKDLKLFGLQEIARVMEAVDYQAERMGKLTVIALGKKYDTSRDKLVRSSFSKAQSQSPREEHSIKCYRCGRAGHMSRECTVTKDKTCRNCGKEGHFAKVCKTKRTHKVNRLTTTVKQEVSDSEDDHVFTVRECPAEATLSILINGQPVDMLIDSGASCNIVTESKFKQLKAKSAIKLQCPGTKVYPFSSKTPLHEKVFSLLNSRRMKHQKQILQHCK